MKSAWGSKKRGRETKQRKSKNTKRAGKNEQLWLHSLKRIQPSTTKSLKRHKKILIIINLKRLISLSKFDATLCSWNKLL
jgi:hypothetical protein